MCLPVSNINKKKFFISCKWITVKFYGGSWDGENENLFGYDHNVALPEVFALQVLGTYV